MTQQIRVIDAFEPALLAGLDWLEGKAPATTIVDFGSGPGPALPSMFAEHGWTVQCTIRSLVQWSALMNVIHFMHGGGGAFSPSSGDLGTACGMLPLVVPSL